MFDGFVHPGLLVGAALAAVPLLIHLLNRQRFKPLAWAAMRFVEAAYRKTRRRARLENLLLLLLRMAAIALLAFALARPFVGARSALSGMTEKRRDVAILVDASYSTGLRDGVRTGFERQLARARELLATLNGPRGDRARLVVASRAPHLLTWRTPEEARDMLDTLGAPSDEPLDLGQALGEIRQHAEELAHGEGVESLEIHLLTDMQRSTFVPDVRGGAQPADGAGPEPTPRLFEELDRLKTLGLFVWVEDLGASEDFPANLAVTALGPETRVL
ncbi:MAG TPA: BatA domain-containing protein, partial [Planctomycetota bacterium]|nr:BatA domain-containing protein [Planctomycetota bacterium]